MVSRRDGGISSQSAAPEAATLPGLVVVAALVSSAVLFFFGTGLSPVAALTWLAPLPTLLIAPRVPAKVAFTVGTVAYFLGTTNSWAYYLNSNDMPLPVSIPVVVVGSLVFGSIMVLFRALLRRGFPLLAATAPPAAWTGVLYLVSVFNPTGVMGTFANMQADVPIVVQLSAFTGMWGLEYIVLLVPMVIATLVAPGVATPARLRTGVIMAVLLGIAFGAGALRLRGNTDPGPAETVAVIANNDYRWAVKSDIGTEESTRLAESFADEIKSLPDGVDTVVLPEGVFAETDATMAGIVDPLSTVAQERDITVVVGVVRHEEGKKFNLALVLPPGGGEPVSYLKHHDQVSPKGHDLVYAPTKSGVQAGIEICLDVNLVNPARDYADARTRLMLVPASDEDVNGWQHSRMGLLRGAENGMAMAWSGQNGQLMISDGNGRVLADTHTDGGTGFATAIADVPRGPGATVYTRIGDVFAWLCMLIAVTGLAVVVVRRNRAMPGTIPGPDDEAKTPPMPPSIGVIGG